MAAMRRLLRALFFAFRRYRPARVSEGLTPAERQALLGTPPLRHPLNGRTAAPNPA